MLGGWFLYLIATRLIGPAAAMVALGVYLFLPFVIEASRSFQPDSLLLAAMLAAIYAIVLYDEERSRGWLLGAGALAGFAILVKPGIAAYFVIGAFLSLAVARHGLRRALWSRELVVFGILASAPTLIYFLTNHGAFSPSPSGDNEPELVQPFLQPDLLGQSFFWKNWAASVASALGSPGPTVGKAVGALVAIAAATGGWLLAPGRARALAIGWLAAYILFAFTFTYNVATHPYYSLPLIPLVALGVGNLGAELLSRLGDSAAARLSAAGGAVAVVAGLALLVPLAERYTFFPGGPTLRRDSPELAVGQFERIGDLVGHSERTLALDRGDGFALRYYGDFAGADWPNAADLRADRLSGDSPTFEQRLRDAESELGGPARYFVATDPSDLLEQREFVDYLKTSGCPLAESSDYVVYRLTSCSAPSANRRVP
jgi:4-amino-4-deoxy-L-arabinose transferase-like glycosyltransferase